MFSKGNKNKTTNSAGSAARKRVPPSIISSDLVITGNLVSEGEIQIDGTVRGDIQSKELLVGETALIEGEIVAESIRVHGKVDGQIKALNVSLAKSAHVVGDILHDNLSIETGAFLEGHCKRLADGEFQKSQKPDLKVTAEKAAPKTTAPATATKKASA
ncbi:polymer-forming cytoskeletal protein [Terasakiella sp. A23]|uniref:bactofilin family protein n=1 Tax=Terasakiella sp. FCG-A23 TaxID=3080561 RepID=UPI002954E7ED|nr:polymer-forming cytoskeletal protein [Terasakiella sp. A23]MDV7341447.1 polymer-forming cytoskeletal protein [Terasakiella sp. A23]